MKFAITKNPWLTKVVKNTGINIKDKLVAKYLEKDTPKSSVKSTDINVLLNRVKINQQKESRKKLFFSAAASTGLVIFGFLLF